MVTALEKTCNTQNILIEHTFYFKAIAFKLLLVHDFPFAQTVPSD